jgi:hypothetical protein
MLLATQTPTQTSTQENGNEDGGNGVMPFPILISVLTLLVAGGILQIRLRKR